MSRCRCIIDCVVGVAECQSLCRSVDCTVGVAECQSLCRSVDCIVGVAECLFAGAWTVL